MRWDPSTYGPRTLSAKPYRTQYVLAQGLKIATIGGCLILSALVVSSFTEFSWWTVYGAIVAFPLGAILGMFTFWPAVRIICHFLNGAPYRDGDVVHILAGSHRGRIVRVYEVWTERGELRVDLGEQEKKAVTDVLDNIQVCRARP